MRTSLSFFRSTTLVAIVAFVVANCTCKREAEPSKESPASFKLAPPDDLDLPHSTTKEALTTEGIPVYVSRSRILVGFDPREVARLGDHDALVTVGVDAKYKGADPSIIQTVHDALDAARKERKLGDWIPAVIAVDQTIPFRVVGEVIVTVQQMHFDRWSFVVKRDDGSFGGIELGKGHVPTDLAPPPPANADAAVAKDAAVYLGVRVVADGFMLRAFNRELGPDCTNATAGTTVPKKDGAYDLAGLVACAAQQKARVPDTHDRFVTISVAPAIAFSEVVRTIDALRATPDGKPLFPDVALAVVH